MKSTKVIFQPKLTLINFSFAFYQRDESRQIEIIVLVSFNSSAHRLSPNLLKLIAVKVYSFLDAVKMQKDLPRTAAIRTSWLPVGAKCFVRDVQIHVMKLLPWQNDLWWKVAG